MKKKIMSVCISIFMLMQCVGAFAAGVYSDSVLDTTVDIFENGGFEDDKEGWIASGYYTINNTANSGGKSLAFIREQTSPTYVTARKVLEVDKNTDYTVSYYVKQVSGSHIFSVYGGSLSNKMLEKFQQTASSDWVKMSYTVNSGDYDRLIVEVKDYSSVNAEIYYDDFSLECAAETPQPALNTLINGGFEWDSTGWTTDGQFLFNGWEGYMRSGNRQLYIHKNTYAHDYAVQEIEVQKNKTFTLSYWYRSPNGDTAKAGHKLRIYMGENTNAYSTADSEWWTSTAAVNQTMAAATEWTKATVTFETGENEKIYIRLMPGAYSNEQMTIVDDMRLELINPDPIKESVMNGDFESGKRAASENAPLYWQGWYELSQNQAHSASTSMALKITRPNYDSMYHSIEVEPNTDYTLEWYEMRQNGSYALKIGKTTVASGGVFYNANGSTEWVKQSVNFNSLDNSSITLQFMKFLAQEEEEDETKSVYFDDVTLTRKSASVKTVEIAGYPSNGKALYASAEAKDDNGTLTGINYQWQSSADGAEWTDIEGATGDKYVVTDDTLLYRVKASAVFNVLYNSAASSAESEGVYSGAVSADDKAEFENDICSDITVAISLKPDGIAANKAYYTDLAKQVSVAREYGIDLETNVSNYSTYLAIEGEFVEVKSSEVSYENDDITIDISFTTPADAEEITKENIVLTCGREAIDYEVSAVTENEKVTGAKITLENKISTADNYQLSVKLGSYCDFSEIYTVPKPVIIENVLLKNSADEIVDRVSDITDGKLTFTADVKNNTYSDGKDLKVITAVYNGSTLYSAKITDTSIAYEGTYNLDVTMDIPTSGLSEEWTTATYVWDDDMITPLVKKTVNPME